MWEQALDALALGLSHVATLLAPTVIVLGGGLADAGPQLVAPLEERLETLVRVGRRPALTLARFGSDAGVTGALLLARDLVDQAPIFGRPVMAMPGVDR